MEPVAKERVMHKRREGPKNSLRTAAVVTLLAALAIGAGACGAGGTTHTGTIAASATSLPTAAGAQASAAIAAPTPAPSAATTQAHAPAPATSKVAAPKPATPAAKATTAAAPAVVAPAPTTPALPARRQPSATEVAKIINSVHALVPLFTPTAAQIAQAGSQVCTAFDQGKTVAQVKAAAMQMAGIYAALIPLGAADSAVRSIVTTYCPGYLSKLV
jgi:hypothetical protein